MGVDVQLYYFFNLSTRCVWVVKAKLWALYHLEIPGTHCIGGWGGGLQRRSGRVWKISPPLGFYSQTVQPIASRYTGWAMPAHIFALWVRQCWAHSTLVVTVFTSKASWGHREQLQVQYVDKKFYNSKQKNVRNSNFINNEIFKTPYLFHDGSVRPETCSSWM